MIEQFIPPYQLSVLKDKNNEESTYFEAVLNALTDTIITMPVTYEQDGLENPIAHLHYFTANADVYITEKDIEDEQLQAYGYINLGHGFEQGYICIQELLENGFEIDFHFNPQSLKKLI